MYISLRKSFDKKKILPIKTCHSPRIRKYVTMTCHSKYYLGFGSNFLMIIFVYLFCYF